jgi:hypothetical protein
LSLLGCLFALAELFVTSLATDPDWSDAIWSDASWSWAARTLAAVGCGAAGYAILEAIKLDQRSRRVLIALAVEALAAAAWLTLGFAATSA